MVVANSSKFEIWGKVRKGNIVILEIPEFLYNSAGYVKECVRVKILDPRIPFIHHHRLRLLNCCHNATVIHNRCIGKYRSEREKEETT